MTKPLASLTDLDLHRRIRALLAEGLDGKSDEIADLERERERRRKQQLEDRLRRGETVSERDRTPRRTERNERSKLTREQLVAEIERRARGKDGDPPMREELTQAMSELLGEDSAVGRALREMAGPPALSPSERRAQRDDALDVPGTRARTQPKHFVEGNEAHKHEAVRPGEQREYTIPGTRLRPDRFDPKKRHIREIKPHTAEGILAGIEKLNLYRRELQRHERERGKPRRSFTMELTLWHRDEKGFRYEHFIVEGDRMFPRDALEKEVRKQRAARRARRFAVPRDPPQRGDRGRDSGARRNRRSPRKPRRRRR